MYEDEAAVSTLSARCNYPLHLCTSSEKIVDFIFLVFAALKTKRSRDSHLEG